MEIIKLFIHIIEFLLVIYFGFAAFYIFVFSFIGIFPGRKKTGSARTRRKFAVLIPGYKEDAVIVEVARDALNQNYPKDRFEVVIIADSFKPETIDLLKKLPVTLVEVSFEKSTKSKALNKAMETLGDNYDVALILDADNMMKPDFIERINLAFDNGFHVVQGHRIAKNTNIAFVVLDVVSEEINNYIFRKGYRNLGFSSALIGSGMAFEYDFFKEIMAYVKAVGGFDKELELKLLRNGNKIEYLHHAIVLDEKVQKSDVFATQRKRWLSAQFIYFRRYFFSGLKELFLKGNIDFFDKVYQMISPPRVLLLGLVTILTLFYGMANLSPALNDFLAIGFNEWLNIFILVLVAFALAVPRSFYNFKTLGAVLQLPKAFFLMFISLFKLKGANKKFIHTAHGVEKKE